jgi:predicted alpha/beta superfamily hydrolase
MRREIILSVLILISQTVLCQTLEKNDLKYGDEYLYYSEYLNRKLKVFIGLPKSYHNAMCNFPVHYVLDGQILFPYYYGTTDMLSRGDIPECIVVGIQSVNRGYYFKPGDGTNEFISFISEELIPFINKNYRTNDFRSICGHSTTGVFVLNTLLYHPELFDSYLAGAPYHTSMILENESGSFISDYTKQKSLLVFFGLNESEKQKSDWDSLHALIEKKDFKRLNLYTREYENEDHYSVIYRYIPDGLKEAFKDWKYQPGQGEEFSLSGLKRYKETQKEKFNVSFDYSDRYFIDQAMNLLRQSKNEDIITLMEYGLSFHPNSVILHNIIAVEYENSGQIELAMKHYRKMLEIDPDLPAEIKSRIPELD